MPKFRGTWSTVIEADSLEEAEEQITEYLCEEGFREVDIEEIDESKEES